MNKPKYGTYAGLCKSYSLDDHEVSNSSITKKSLRVMEPKKSLDLNTRSNTLGQFYAATEQYSLAIRAVRNLG